MKNIRKYFYLCMLDISIIGMRHKDIIIESGNPFVNCKLDREKYADILTSVIDSNRDGFVLAIDGKWGTGKSTFVKMWQRKMADYEYKTLYFNAWENDFVSEPMVGLLGEIQTLITKETEQTFSSILAKAAKFSSKIIPALAKTTASIAGLGVISDAIEAVASATVDSFNDEIKQYDKKKESLTALKQELSQFVKNVCGETPLVFIVDELDRCRPDYAVEVLEKIKHLFSVDGIVFVLSIDKKQLGNSVRGYYGSDQIDADEYLRRFIDITYTLPEPSYESYCKYLYDYFRFDEFFRSEDRRRYNFSTEINAFITFTHKLSAAKQLTLRQVEKLFVHTRVTIRSFNSNQYVLPDLISFLIYSREFAPEFYDAICSVKLPLQDLVDKFEWTYKIDIESETTQKNGIKIMHYILSYILVFYNNSQGKRKATNLDLINLENDELILTTGKLDRNYLSGMIKSISSFHEINDLFIDLFTNKIDLLDDITSK